MTDTYKSTITEWSGGYSTIIAKISTGVPVESDTKQTRDEAEEWARDALQRWNNPEAADIVECSECGFDIEPDTEWRYVCYDCDVLDGMGVLFDDPPTIQTPTDPMTLTCGNCGQESKHAQDSAVWPELPKCPHCAIREHDLTMNEWRERYGLQALEDRVTVLEDRLSVPVEPKVACSICHSYSLEHNKDDSLRPIYWERLHNNKFCVVPAGHCPTCTHAANRHNTRLYEAKKPVYNWIMQLQVSTELHDEGYCAHTAVTGEVRKVQRAWAKVPFWQAVVYDEQGTVVEANDWRSEAAAKKDLQHHLNEIRDLLANRAEDTAMPESCEECKAEAEMNKRDNKADLEMPVKRPGWEPAEINWRKIHAKGYCVPTAPTEIPVCPVCYRQQAQDPKGPCYLCLAFCTKCVNAAHRNKLTNKARLSYQTIDPNWTPHLEEENWETLHAADMCMTAGNEHPTVSKTQPHTEPREDCKKCQEIRVSEETHLSSRACGFCVKAADVNKATNDSRLKRALPHRKPPVLLEEDWRKLHNTGYCEVVEEPKKAPASFGCIDLAPDGEDYAEQCECGACRPNSVRKNVPVTEFVNDLGASVPNMDGFSVTEQGDIALPGRIVKWQYLWFEEAEMDYEHLRSLGERGWEMCGTLPRRKWSGKGPDRFYFKRML